MRTLYLKKLQCIVQVWRGKLGGMRTLLALCLSLLLGLSLWLGLSPKGVRSQPFYIALGSQQQVKQFDQQSDEEIVGQTYLPTEGTAPYPTAILCHGVSSSKDTMKPLAIALAQRGIAAVTFDFGGYGESYRRSESLNANLRDTQRVIDWVRQQPQLDADRLGIGGHSMGGTTALEAALQDRDLRTTFLLSIAGVATPTSPQNLFFGSGIYEELNPVSVIKEFWALAIAKNTAVEHNAADSGFQRPMFQQVGQLETGTARRLVFSPTADHLLAPYDKILVEEVADWVAQSLGLSEPQLDFPQLQPSINPLWRLLAQVWTGGSVLALLIHLYSRLYRYVRARSWLLGLRIAVSAIAIGLLTDSLSWSKSSLPMLVVVLIVGNYCCRDDLHRSCSFAAKIRLSVLYISLIALVFGISLGIHALIAGSLLAYPRAIAYLPQLVISLPIALTYDRVNWLLYRMESGIGVSIAGLLIAIEIMRPSWVLLRLSDGVTKGVTVLRQPLQNPFSPTSAKDSRQTWMLAGGLLLVLAIALSYQYQTGVLTWDAAQFVLKLALGFIVVPLVLLSVGIRSRLFRAIEKTLAKPPLHQGTFRRSEQSS